MKRGGWLIAGLLVGGLLLATPASARTFQVTRTADTAPNGCNPSGCTLREAVIAANNRAGADEVVLKRGKSYALARPGVDEELALTGDLDSTGPLTLRARGRGARPVINGADLDRILHTFAPANVRSIVIRNGNMTSPISETGDGGGIFARADLILQRSVVRDNAADDNGEGIAADYGASITLIRSAVVRNQGQGVREEDTGSIVLKRSRVTGNEELGIEEGGDGGIRLLRSHLIRNGGAGLREFDDGGVRVARSTILRNEGEGVDASGPGGLVLRRAKVSGNEGMGVLDSQPVARITRSVVARNDNVGVFQYSGALQISGTQVLRNTANQDGGGISALSTASVKIDRTTVARNSTPGNGGGISAVSFPTTAPAVITRSTISGNSAEGRGGGIYGDARLVTTNSTVASNRAGAGGGIYINGGSGSALNAVSVVRNVADDDYGGGLYLANDAPLAVKNSLIALNQATCLGCGSPDCINEQDPFTSGGNNLLSTKENCSGFDLPSDRERSNPKIGALKDNGGPTKTIALKQGSPAINKAGNDAPNRDQRGRRRGRNPDIGAFER